MKARAFLRTIHSPYTKWIFVPYPGDSFLIRGSGEESEIKEFKVLKNNHKKYLNSYWLEKKEPHHGAEPFLSIQQSLVTAVIFAFLPPIYDHLLTLKKKVIGLYPFSFLFYSPTVYSRMLKKCTQL